MRTLLAVLAGACGESERALPPQWIQVVPNAEAELQTVRVPCGDLEAELRHDAHGSTIDFIVPRAAWRQHGQTGRWVASVPEPTEEEGDPTLTTPDGPVQHRDAAVLSSTGEIGFCYEDGGLILGGFPTPPETATFRWPIPVANPSSEQAQCGRFAGVGFDVIPGRGVSAVLTVPRDSVLRFGLASEPLFPGAAGTPAVVRVRLDGELLFEHEATASSITRHVVPLPRSGAASARLDFEVHGAAARVVFFDPIVGPRAIGSPGARPWPEVRPDLLVFVADTLRADTLTACGGKGIAPNLDALAETGLCFTRARSAATWTLSSHATLFTGHYPRQVFAPSNWHLLDANVTVAERLRRAGYRTEAVTDGGSVSSAFGLAQGFGRFVEMNADGKDLPEVLAEARASIEADDGRPLFLFMQTYRVHWPYVGGSPAPEKDRTAGAEAETLVADVIEEARAFGLAEYDRDLPASDLFVAVAQELRELYDA